MKIREQFELQKLGDRKTGGRHQARQARVTVRPLFEKKGLPRLRSNRSLSRLYVARLAHYSEHRFYQIDLCVIFVGRDAM